ncbi:MAG: phage tail protein, partial [Bdellovibrionales bacterium]|nr:phage tail protein [Bdellovibrionales bacterium]
FITNPSGNLVGEEVMRITESGQVGINTSAPTADLHVEGSVYVSSDMVASDSITVSNIKIEGNTISSIDTDGSINIIPEGAGTVSIGDAAKSVKTSVDLVSEATQFSGITFFDDVTEKWFVGQGSATTNDKLIFRRDGTNNDLVIDTNGNIGVGETLTPGGLLSLGSSLGHNKLLIWQNADASSWFGMGAQANQWSFSLDVPADKYSFFDSKTQTNEIFTILGDGKVAVGDSSPEARFGVVLPDSNGVIGNDHLGMKLRLNSNQNSDSVGIGFAVNTDENQKYKAGIFFQKGIMTNSRGDLILANSNDDDTTSVDISDARMAIKSDGKVGVGTLTPTAQLEVSANNNHFKMVEADNSNKAWDMQVEGSNLLVSESSVGARMTFEAGGEVGIGTTTPSTTLHISTANQSPLRLTATSGSTTGITMDGNNEANDKWSFLAGIGATKEFVMSHFDGSTTTDFLRFVDTVADPNKAYFSNTNVGVQNDNPSAIVHIGKTTDTVNRVLKLDSAFAAGIEIDANADNTPEADQNAYIKLRSNGSQVGVLGYINQNDKDPFGNGYTDGLNGALLLSSDGNPEDILQLGTSQEARITIDGLGQVGIGTKTPTSRLSIVGGVNQNGGDVNLSSGSLFINNLSGNIGIGSIAPNAVLDVNSTTSGILLPRMTNAQRDAISSPPESMMIFSTEDKIFYFYSDGSWNPVGSGGGSNPIGTITSWAGNGAIPQGWLECNGSAVSRTVYSQLFSAIGTAWGHGDTFTTFNLPDLRG